MKLIVSAYRSSASPGVNTRETGRLIGFLTMRGVHTELAIGTYEGLREICVICTGRSEESLRLLADEVMYKFHQNSAYLEAGSRGYLLCKGNGDVPLGQELNTLVVNWAAHLPDNYTETLDGRMIVAKEGL